MDWVFKVADLAITQQLPSAPLARWLWTIKPFARVQHSPHWLECVLKEWGKHLEDENAERFLDRFYMVEIPDVCQASIEAMDGLFAAAEASGSPGGSHAKPIAGTLVEPGAEEGGAWSGGEGEESVGDYVTLKDIAMMVRRSKRTVEKLVEKGTLPAPEIRGGRGKPHEWRLSKLRPLLERLYGRPLPDVRRLRLELNRGWALGLTPKAHRE